MLYSVVLELEALAPCTIASGSGYQAYGLFLALLSSRWPETAQELHRDQGPKPFTLSPVQAVGRRSRNGLRLEVGAGATIRVTCLEDRLMERLVDAVVSWPAGEPVSLGGIPFQLKGLVTRPGARPGCRVSSFQELVESARPASSFSLRFASPTTFRSGGQRNVVFPSVRLVFHSLLARWDQYSPSSFHLALPDDLESWVSAREYHLSTRLMDFGTYLEQGFQGTCQYQVSPEAGEELRQVLAALAEFARFGGVGAKTTMGMGQCWRIPMGPLGGSN